MKLIGLAGYAQAGKDTVGSILVEEHGFTRVAFADKLRDVLYALNPLVEIDSPEGPGRTTQALQGALVTHTWEALKKQAAASPWGVRAMLQRLGTDAVRTHLGNNAWVDAALSDLEPDGSYVITDVRFPNEADAIRDERGKVWRVVRQGTGPVNDHPSETALDDYAFDGFILNNGTLDELARTVATKL